MMLLMHNNNIVEDNEVCGVIYLVRFCVGIDWKDIWNPKNIKER